MILIERDFGGGWPENRVWRRFFVFSTFDQLCDPVSLWNHQKWIPHEISHRYRSGELEKTFFRAKIHEKSWKIAKIDCRTPGVPATYYGSSHWFFFGDFRKISHQKNVFFEHETKTQKFDLASFSIRSSAYVAQFLDRLEHSECTKLFGDFFFAKMPLKFPKMLRCNGIPIVMWSHRVENTGEIKKSRAKKIIFFEHETKTKKFDLPSLYIGYSRYAAQFLDHLEHSECTKLFGDFFFAIFF